MFDKFHEECGVFGIHGHEEAARLAYLGLYALQHRGQESAGIVSSDGSRLHSERGMGQVSDIFKEEILERLTGSSAIGHVRYSTAGKVSINEAQPFAVKCSFGQIALCHNGNLPDATEARFRLEQDGAIFSSTSDTEVVLHRIARSRRRDLVEAIVEALMFDDGAYSMLFATPDSLIAIRDPRPRDDAAVAERPLGDERRQLRAAEFRPAVRQFQAVPRQARAHPHPRLQPRRHRQAEHVEPLQFQPQASCVGMG